MISLLIEYFRLDEVVAGLTQQILQHYKITFMCLKHVVGRRKGV